jgi:hypothetical protein
LIWIKIRKQKGGFLATFGVFLGFVGIVLLTPAC